MKNVILLHTSPEIHAWIRGRLRTPEFQKSYDTKGWLYEIVNDFAKTPRFAFEKSDEVEHAHFSTWWSGILIRDYENAYIHDCYLVHEMDHARKMPYRSGLPFQVWTRKMEDNELTASVTSEIMVYFEIQGIREKTFPHPIFADRFLQKGAIGEAIQWEFKNTKQAFERGIELARREPMFREPDTNDIPAYWIYRFSNQNAAWFAIWAYNYQLVEFLMENLVKAKTNKEKEDGLKAHVNALLQNGVNGVPFYDEAVAFDGVYRAARKVYDSAMKEKQNGH